MRFVNHFKENNTTFWQGEIEMTIILSEKEVTLLCGLINDEQNSSEYVHCWDNEQRKLFDDIMHKLNKAHMDEKI